VNLERWQLIIPRSKHGGPRYIPLDDTACRALPQLRQRANGSGRVMVLAKGGHRHSQGHALKRPREWFASAWRLVRPSLARTVPHFRFAASNERRMIAGRPKVNGTQNHRHDLQATLTWHPHISSKPSSSWRPGDRISRNELTPKLTPGILRRPKCRR
jgi:hypothetical protein